VDRTKIRHGELDVRIEGGVMNRSVERRGFTVRGTCPGELVVGLFIHPTRGRVRCPAAPLVAANLRGQGHNVREERDWLASADGASDGVLFTASYLDRTGAAVGLAVAAHDTDRVALRAAQEAVLAWSAAWRSRRLVIAAAEPCHPGEHQADACQHVTAARREMRRCVQRGDQVVLVGRRGQPATTALAELHDEVVLVEAAAEVAGLRVDPDRVSYLVAPGVVLEHAMRVVATLRARHPRLRGPHPGDLCYAASDDLATVHAMAAACDRVLVLGAATAPDTASVVDAAADARKPVHIVDGLERIRPAWLAGAESLGLATAPSAPPHLLHAVVDALSGMGPLSVVRRRVTTQPAGLDLVAASCPDARTPHMPAI
jgi:4-hydroxy-3-methylbut-2-en-1-yl diphosphate reductase